MGTSRLYILLLLLLLPLCAKAQSSCVPDSAQYERTVDYYFLHALSLVEQEEYDAAFDLFEHCRALAPASSSVLYELANMYHFLGRKEEALSILKGIVRDNPKNIQLWQSLLQYYSNEGDKNAIIEVLEEMVRVFPDNSDVYMDLSAYYAEQARFREAIAALKVYEKIEGKSEFVSMQKYRMYLMLQQKDSALAEVRSLAAEAPGDLRYLTMEGDIYLMFGDRDKAFAVLSEVLAKEPDNVQAQLSMVGYYSDAKNDTMFVRTMENLMRNEKLDADTRENIMLELVRYKEKTDSSDYIIKLFDELMELPFGVVQTGCMYVSYLMHTDKGNDAMRPVLEKILSIEPDNRAALLQQLIIAIESEDYLDIIAKCDRAIMYCPDFLELYRYRGLAYYLIGDIKEALITYHIGIEKCAPDTDSEVISDTYALMGDTHYELGHYRDCFESYDSALVYNGNNINVLNNYAYYMALQGQSLERALEMSRRTLQEAPDEATYIDTYMWVLFLLGRYEEAEEYAVKLLSLDNEKSSVEFHHCGDIFAKNNKIDKAVECWIKAQELGDDSKILKRKIKKRKYIPNGKKR